MFKSLIAKPLDRSRLPFVLLLFALAAGCSAMTANPDGGDAVAGTALLAAELLPVDRDVPGPLAIGDLLVEGKPCDLGREVGAALPNQLKGRRPELDVISFQNLHTLLETQNLQMEDLFADTAPAPGRLMPARTLLVGFFFPKGDEGTTLEAQILDLETGAVLCTARTFFPERIPRPLDAYTGLPLEVEFQATARSRGLDEVILIEEGDILYSGDLVRLRVKPNRPAHLYVFLLDSGGEAELLFPEGPGGATRLEAGELILPSSMEYFRLDDHPGTETILVAASLEPIEKVDALLDKLDLGAAVSNSLLRAVEESGRKGFVETSGALAGKDGAVSEVMRSYTGTVWRRIDFEHRP